MLRGTFVSKPVELIIFSDTSIRLNEQQNTGKTSFKPGKVILLTNCHYSREITANSRFTYELFTDFNARDVSLLYIHINNCNLTD